MSTPPVHPADSHDLIRVVGARVNNLRDVSVDLPKRRLTVFTGVSGSGKSSLVFGTITDVNAMLRILFSRLSTPYIGASNAFSFNVPSVEGSGEAETASGKKTSKTFTVLGGMCPRCEGLGAVADMDLDQLYDDAKSLNEGALTVPGFTPDGWYGRTYSKSGYFDPDKPIKDFTAAELDALLHKEPTRIKVDGINVTYEGLIPRIQKSMLAKDIDSVQPHIRAFLERAVTQTTCPECDGTRLAEPARTATIAGVSIADVCRYQITDVAQWLRTIDDPAVAPLMESLRAAVDSFVEIGLGYLNLERPTGTLSGGEAQRIKMIRHLGSSLTDITYVFDEPTVGLHPHDIARMNDLLIRLRDKGNTVLVVEHKPEVIAIADHIVDLGPRAGSNGGQICYEGDIAGLRGADTLTGRHLHDRATLKDTVRTPTGALEVRGAEENNLRGVDVDIPLGVLVAITGVAGSGKSSLIHGSVSGRDGVIAIDQTAIRGSRRSNPATYTGLLDPIRKAFAKENGVKPSLFSANSEGACPTCKGAGVIYTDLVTMAGVTTTCEDCDGKRFSPDVLHYRLGGQDISDVLAMPVERARGFFGDGPARTPAAAKILARLADVGLGYITLGQPLTTLSGGERQRLKLATAMADKAQVYVLDEPTTGLHLADVQQLLGMLDGLVEAGKSVIVIEHHQAVMAHADWVIDLGPGAGHDGGRVVFEGTPRAMVDAAQTVTGRHLADYVA
ncbi:ATP-binding cassette domain-containing protein [Gordonia sp. (in: high G+C Gram-positive bacteria)]|uniref:ATP-binding cassette domain-containing protein n=1 Tax=Gordonia sp. (in: high G+C Gram-positive bacteria) TaxID=84139 RepID=UPI0039E37F5E